MAEVSRRALELDGREISYLHAGEGPPVLLLHGTFWSRVWQPIIPRIAEGNEVFALDYPGFGRSGGRLGPEEAAAPALASDPHGDLDRRSGSRRVGDFLADFASYGEWNPHVVEGRGRAAPGEGLDLRFRIPNEGEKTYEPTVGSVEPGRRLSWRASSKVFGLPVPGFLDREHYFSVEPLGEDRSRLVHGERFSGLLVPFFWRSLDTNVRCGFGEMNRALEERARRSAGGRRLE